MHRYFAGHGYAAVRVDLRGTGDSEGVLCDEYHEQEQRDGLEVIDWIASQPWCSGAVGMIGKSWGGFNALQIAAHRPPALGGVISVCASDDRYADDAHYMGGCLLTENFSWGSVLTSLVAHPPDPALVGSRWRALWLERLAHAEPFAARWLRHPLRDGYWRHGSVAEDLARIACPVYAVGGWADAYSNAVPRLVAGLSGPRKGLVGPWAHLYPHEAVPRPAIGFLQEALRWWDHCLGGEAADDEPVYRVWMQEGGPPRGGERPGRWVAEERWPSPRIERRRLALGAAGLDAPGPARTLELCSPQTTGMAAGAWCGFGLTSLPGDQAPDDAGSLCFDSAPLDERLEILGAPRVRVEVASDQPVAFLVARLVDLAPDGAAERVSYGLANLTHDAGHTRWAPLVPGRRYVAEIALNDAAHAFAPGHRLRVALSTCYWPVVWPSPEPVTLSVFAGSGWLELPVRPPRAEDAALRAFEPPEAAPRPAVVDLEPGWARRRVERDPASREVAITTELDLDEQGGPPLSRVEAIDLVTGYGITRRVRIREDDPLAASIELDHASVLQRDPWRVRIETHHRITATRERFRVEASLRALEGDKEVFSRIWDERIPRQGI
jgi:uncharacterized protein